MSDNAVSKESLSSEQESPRIWATPSAPPREPARERGGPASEKVFVYVIVAAVIAFIIVAVNWFSTRAVATYVDAAKSAQTAYAEGRIDAHSALTYQLVFARAQDATLVKGGALLLSFLVVILGVLMVLEGSKAFYKLNVEGGGKKSALETSSPGLVMITLGLALVYGVMMYKTEFNLSSSNQGQPQASFSTDEAGAPAQLQAASPSVPQKKKEPAFPDKTPVTASIPDKGPVPAPAPTPGPVSAPVADTGPARPVPAASPVGLQAALAPVAQRLSAPSRMDVRVSGMQPSPLGGASDAGVLVPSLPVPNLASPR